MRGGEGEKKGGEERGEEESIPKFDTPMALILPSFFNLSRV